MGTIECIIFSCDRAMQLENLLTSIKLCCNDLFDQITVLYNTTTEEFELGYNLLKSRYQHVRFIKETNFKTNVLDILKNSIHRYTCLIVDDAIFYKKLPDNYKIKILHTFENNIISFILGVGRNTIWSMTANISFNFPIKYKYNDYEDVYLYNWKNDVRKTSEFECPFMLVGNIYETNLLYKYSNDIEFKKPNSYEIKLQMFIQQFYRNVLPNMCACFKSSVVLHSPNNCVQKEWIGGYQNLNDPVELNKLYLNGYVIDYNVLKFHNVIGLHHNVDLLLKQL